MGSQKVNDETNFYNQKINKFVKNTQYNNPTDIGFTKQNIIHSNMTYKLIQKSHSIVCDDSLCKVIYLSSDNHKQNNIYPKYPIYSRINNNDEYKDTPHHLCAICIHRS